MTLPGKRLWTDERCLRAIEVLRACERVDDVLAILSAEWRLEVTEAGLTSALLRYTETSIKAELGRDIREERLATAQDIAETERGMLAAPPVELPDDRDAESAPSSPLPHERFAELVDLVKRQTKRGGVTLEQLCDELEMSPRAAREYLEDAREVGITIDIAHEKLLFRAPEPAPSAPPVAVAPTLVPGRDHRIGVFSDLHYGSRYCLREQHRDFVLRCYHEYGIRDFFCSGDVLEGYYRHAAFERTAESQEDQAAEFLDWLPQLDGMRVFFIDGNHDFTWTDRNGIESGRTIVRMARERGRDDLHFFGSRGALIQYGDTRIELWHPKKGKAYAISYQLQNKIRDTAPERLPNILICGHVHEYVKFRRSNVFAFYAGCFQHGDAPFGRSIGGDVAMGGIVIDWRVDEDGVIRELGDRFVLAHHTPKVFDVAVPA